MSDPEAQLDAELEDEGGYYNRGKPACRYCGTRRVIWLAPGGKWTLCDDETGERHQCAKRAETAATNDFAQFRRQP